MILEIEDWRVVRTDKGDKAKFRCPECGIYGYITNHRIDDDGKVNPSVVCSEIKCSFQKYIILKNWNKKI